MISIIRRLFAGRQMQLTEGVGWLTSRACDPDRSDMRKLNQMMGIGALVVAASGWGAVSFGADEGHGHAAPAAHATPVEAHPQPTAVTPATLPAETPSPEVALRMLIEGNERYVSETLNHPNANAARRC
jgi:hypothetical protein